MKRLIILLLLVPIMTSCKYEVSLHEGEELIMDRSLIGKWIIEEDGESAEVEIGRNKDEYLILYKEEDTEYLFRGYLFKLDEMLIAELELIEMEGKSTPDSVEKYLIYKIDIEEDKLGFQGINLGSVHKKYGSTSELRSDFKEGMNNTDTFADMYYLSRIE